MSDEDVRSNWREEIRRNWQNINLQEFCIKIGIDFQFNFEGTLESTQAEINPYPQYRWEILPNSRIHAGVLHLFPPHIGDLPALWEEWFFEDGEIHHHVLRNHGHDLGTHTWLGGEDDLDHPREVLKIRWHYFNDGDLRPIGFR